MKQLTLYFKDRKLESYPIKNGMLIGRDPRCDIVIDSLAINKQHARIDLLGEKTSIVNLGSGILINQQPQQSALLESGHEITVGKHTLIYSILPDEEPLAAPPPFDMGHEPDDLEADLEPEPLQRKKPVEGFLQVMNGANVGKTLSLQRNLTNIGKAGVQAAVVIRRDSGFFLSHLEGKSYPLVNGVSIGENSHELHDGDQLQIGNIKLLFSSPTP